jgi:DNA replication regulator SLD2
MTSTGDQHERKRDEELKERLRAELKTWERAFEKETGHKPTPADVKANSEISTKYKIYHKSFRTKSSSSTRTENPKRKSDYISSTNALKQITPNKRHRDNDVLTPVNGVQVSDDVEAVGPTPQLNGRMLGLFDGILDSTPLSKRRKLNWGEQLADARKNSPKKSTPQKRLLGDVFSPEYSSRVSHY